MGGNGYGPRNQDCYWLWYPTTAVYLVQIVCGTNKGAISLAKGKAIPFGDHMYAYIPAPEASRYSCMMQGAQGLHTKAGVRQIDLVFL
jgi:D-serine dehydratase